MNIKTKDNIPLLQILDNIRFIKKYRILLSTSHGIRKEETGK